MLEYSLPPGYRRQKPVRRPRLAAWQGIIDAILEEDKQRPKKQRHTAKRIFERLKAEHAYSGGYTIVKDYVRQSRISRRESVSSATTRRCYPVSCPFCLTARSSDSSFRKPHFAFK
jgi:transposase